MNGFRNFTVTESARLRIRIDKLTRKPTVH
jgi:hypothetical protein